MFFDDLKALCEAYGVEIPPHLMHQLYTLNVGNPNPDPSGQRLPPGCKLANIDGCPGLVFLTGVSGHWGTQAYAIDEVGDYFAEGSDEYAFIKANVSYANGVYMTGQLIPACKPLKKNPPPMVNGSAKAFLGTQACPSDNRGTEFLRTVAEATAHYVALPQPTTGTDFPHT